MEVLEISSLKIVLTGHNPLVTSGGIGFNKCNILRNKRKSKDRATPFEHIFDEITVLSCSCLFLMLKREAYGFLDALGKNEY